MKNFAVDEALLIDAYFVCDFELSRLYVKNDKENPWFVLVPMKINAIELLDLTGEEQGLLMEEVTLVSEFLKTNYTPYKINIGSLGNIVRQLHFHVMARYQNDRAWPKPLWGIAPRTILNKEELETIKINFLRFIN